MSTIVRTITRPIAVLAMALVLLAGTALPASASESWQVNPTRACQQQYGGGVFGASVYTWSPNGIYCYGLSFPFSTNWIGSLSKNRINNYCKATHRGSRAVIGAGWRNPLAAWWCKKG